LSGGWSLEWGSVNPHFWGLGWGLGPTPRFEAHYETFEKLNMMNSNLSATAANLKVSVSSQKVEGVNNWQLDGMGCWKPNSIVDKNPHIQFESPAEKKWVGIVIQGAGNRPEWVTDVIFEIILFKDNSRRRLVNNNGTSSFKANFDKNTKVPIEFSTPVTGNILVIKPVPQNSPIALRVDAYFHGN
jgi:hypothetical protein